MDAELAVAHLGGFPALRLMVGAEHFTKDEDRVFFAFKGCRRANKAEVYLAPDDTYTLTLYHVSARGAVKVEASEGIHAEELREHFEAMTGLRLGVPR